MALRPPSRAPEEDLPVVLLAGDDEHALPLALVRASGGKIRKAELFAGRAHPAFHAAVSVMAGGREIRLFDVGALWSLRLGSVFNGRFVTPILQAARRSAAIVVASSRNAERTRTLSRIAAALGVPRALGVNDEKIPDEISPEDFLASWPESPVIEVPAKGKGRSTALLGLLETMAAMPLDRTPTPPVAAFVPERVTGFGLEPGVLRAAGDRSPAFARVGAPLEVITPTARHRVIVSALDEHGVVFQLAGVRPEAVRALVMPGSGEFATEIGVRLHGAAEGERGQLFAHGVDLGQASLRGECLTLEGEPHAIAPRAPGTVHISGEPFLLEHHTRPHDIAVTVGTFA